MAYTLEQIKNAFNTKADDNPFLFRKIIRPLSYYFTYISLRIGISTPNRATVAGFICGCFSLIFIVLPEQNYLILGAGFYFIYYIFDHVDGNIARVSNQATYFGKYLDGIVNAVINSLVLLAFSFRQYLVYNNPYYLYSGVIVFFVYILSCFVVTRTSFFNLWVKLDIKEGKVKESILLNETNPLTSGKFTLKKMGNLAIDLQTLAIFMSIFIGMNFWLYIMFLVPIGIWCGALIFVTMIRAYRQLNIHRYSKTDSRLNNK
ncbi:MAG: CDP-alcohol phosphatidyltransferase family protein [Candidatus Omnitrophica bacterium]|nr:CDP-alcohol phosphatidyltransferase family protein [Candidatus Omnitrophota bacterium]